MGFDEFWGIVKSTLPFEMLSVNSNGTLTDDDSPISLPKYVSLPRLAAFKPGLLT